MSDAAAAATPSNFDAHLASVDMSGPDDGGTTQVQDNTGPSNTNALTPSREPMAPQGDQQRDGPEYRVGDDGQPLELDENGMQLGDQQPEEHEGEVGDQPTYEQYQQMNEAIQQPDLHEYFYDKRVKFPDGSTKTVRELVNDRHAGTLRMSDYSRKTQEAAAYGRQAQQVVADNRMLFQRMTDPNVLRATMKHLGPAHEQAFEAAATMLAKERLALMRMQPHERAAYEAQQQVAERDRQLQEMREQLQRREQENQPHPAQQYVQPIHQTLDQHVPAAWARHGLRNSGPAIRAFAEHIQAVWDGRMETIPQAVEAATIATAEELGDRVAQHNQEAQQNAPRQSQQQPLAPRRLPPGGPPPGQRQRQPMGLRVSDFDAYLKGKQ